MSSIKAISSAAPLQSVANVVSVVFKDDKQANTVSKILAKTLPETFLKDALGKSVDFSACGSKNILIELKDATQSIQFSHAIQNFKTALNHELGEKTAEKVLKMFSFRTAYPSLDTILDNFVARYGQATGLKKSDISKAAQYLLTSDSRFTEVNPKGAKELADRLAQTQQASSKETSTILNKVISREFRLGIPPWHNTTVKKLLLDVLVAAVPRPVDKVSVGGLEVTQILGHFDNKGQLVPTTLSSDGIKTKGLINESHAANQGTVEADKRILVARSANSSSVARMMSSQEGDLRAAVAAKEGVIDESNLPTGFYRREDGQLAFAWDIATFQDWNRVIKTGERHKIERIFKLAEDMPERTIEIGGRKVILEKPQVINLPMSAFAYGVRNNEDARQKSLPAARRLYSDLTRELLKDPEFASLKQEAQAAKTDEERARILRKCCDALKDDSEAICAAKAVHIMLSGYTLENYKGNFVTGRRANKGSDPADTMILMQALYKKTNRLLHVECKSGEDRTLGAVAGLTAATAFQKVRGKSFDPFTCTSQERDEFRKFYTQAADALGKNVNRIVRGNSGKIKWNTRPPHPGPQKYYIIDRAERTKNGIAAESPIGITSWKSFNPFGGLGTEISQTMAEAGS